MRIFVVVIAFATAMVVVNGGDVGHPYTYDQYPATWNHHSQENAALTGQLASTGGWTYYPSVKRQFFQLFGEGVPAAFLFSVIGALANFALTSLQFTSANQRIDDTNMRIDDLPDLSGAVSLNTAGRQANAQQIANLNQGATVATQTCTAVQALLAIDGPMYAADTPSPTPNAVSSDLDAPYFVNPIIDVGASGDEVFDINSLIPPGDLDITVGPAGTGNPLGRTADSAALSIQDFNTFRRDVLNIINILDAKIRDILNVPAPTCP